MKLKTMLAVLLATYLLPVAAFSQTNAAAADQTAVAAQPAAVADTNTAPVAAPTNAVAEAQPAVAVADTNAAAPGVATIPLIQFQDVPLTTAIEALARQANINYLLDPKIGFGQPDATGQIKAEPPMMVHESRAK